MTKIMVTALAVAVVLIGSIDTADAKKGHGKGTSNSVTKSRLHSRDPARDYGGYPSWAAYALSASGQR